MVYDPDSMKEKELPSAGDKISAKIIDIKNGKLLEFVSDENLAKWNNVEPQAECIQIEALTDDGQIRRTVMTVPIDGEAHPRSNMGKWKAAYGGYPKIGQKIFLIADSQGYYQFFLK